MDRVCLRGEEPELERGSSRRTSRNDVVSFALDVIEFLNMEFGIECPLYTILCEIETCTLREASLVDLFIFNTPYYLQHDLFDERVYMTVQDESTLAFKPSRIVLRFEMDAVLPSSPSSRVKRLLHTNHEGWKIIIFILVKCDLQPNILRQLVTHAESWSTSILEQYYDDSDRYVRADQYLET